MNAEKDVRTIGADGQPMHSLIADKSGKLTVRLLKIFARQREARGDV